MPSDKKRQSKPAFDHFGYLAPIYNKLIRPPNAGMLMDLLEPGQNDILLDVGGGTGRVAIQFTDLVRKIVVFDVSHPMLSQANHQRVFHPVQGVAEVLPFGDKMFDRIVAVDSFHHFRNRELVSRELLRILAPGGRLIIEEPDIRRLIVKFIALGETLLFMRSHFQPPERISEYFSLPGYRVRLHENGTPNFWIAVDKDPSGIQC
jgi:demethylmenaquinone methyltransferase/2-methoxy-6-polyprenyl-1,4-benzoquinol methylase